MNRENFERVLDHIKADPSCWKQAAWHCGTQHCFAGWAQLLSGKAADDDTVRQDARVFLDISKLDADWLFAPSATIARFEDMLAGRDGYDRDGYDRAGYNCDGYNCDGYNRDGYNRAGYNRDGYNRAGYNRAGYNRAGYDCAGYDCDGLDKGNKPRAGAAA